MARRGGITVSNEVVFKRNNVFARMERGADRVVRETVEQMARDAKAAAPVRTGRLRNSIEPVIFPGGNRGSVIAKVPYADYQEQGTAAHPISGYLAFYWEKRGRKFIWNNPVYDNWDYETGVTVNHPGHSAANGGRGYLRPAFERASINMPTLINRYLP